MTAPAPPLEHLHRGSSPPRQKSRNLYVSDYVQFVRAHWRLIAAVFLMCLVAGMAAQFMVPAKFKARTDIVVVATTNLTTEGKDTQDVSIDSAVQVLLSDRVLGKTARELNYPGRSSGLLEDLSISPLINSRILQLNVAAQTPEQALAAVSLLARNFMDARQKSMNIAQEAQIQAIGAQLKAVTASLANPTATGQLQGASLDGSNRALTQLQSDLQAELISLSVIEPAAGYIAHAGTLPTSSTRPGFVISFASSAAVGLLLGCLAAYASRFRRTHAAAHLVPRGNGRKDRNAEFASDRP